MDVSDAWMEWQVLSLAVVALGLAAWGIGCALAVVVDWARGVWIEMRATEVREEWL